MMLTVDLFELSESDLGDLFSVGPFSEGGGDMFELTFF